LQSGKVIAGTTDTIFGLLANLTYESFLALNIIKGREQKPYIILIKNADSLSHFVSIRNDSYSNFHIEKLIQQCWPGPLTLIFKAKADVPSFMKAADGTIALRVPKHEGLQQLLAQKDGLFSTSANRAGQPPAKTIQELDEQIKQSINYAVIDKGYEQHEQFPSTILDCTTDKIKVVREGMYPLSDIKTIVSLY
jgi:tRNA threonylcarbamoyl adenosine modification protein (Sua5/YciO/YrdC/YwlC family)